MSADRIGAGALAVGLVLLAVPFVAPASPVLWHDTGPTIADNETRIAEDGYEVIAYENLSDRGQQLYRETLEHDGTYRVSTGEGAPEFSYPTEERLNEGNVTEQLTTGAIVIERSGDADLPPADEEPGQERYDLVQTATREPPFTSPPRLARAGAFVLGLAVFTVGFNRVVPR